MKNIKNLKNLKKKDEVYNLFTLNFHTYHYLTTENNPNDPVISPVFADTKNFMGFPKTDLFYGEFDVFRSHDEAYIDKLKEAKVEVQGFVFNKAMHSIFYLKAASDISLEKKQIIVGKKNELLDAISRSLKLALSDHIPSNL